MLTSETKAGAVGTSRLPRRMQTGVLQRESFPVANGEENSDTERVPLYSVPQHWDHLLAGLDKASHRFNLHQGPLISKYSDCLEIHMISITKSYLFFFNHLRVIK